MTTATPLIHRHPWRLQSQHEAATASHPSSPSTPYDSAAVASSRGTGGALGTGNRDFRPPSSSGPGVGGVCGDGSWLVWSPLERTPSDAEAVRGRDGAAEAASFVLERGRVAA